MTRQLRSGNPNRTHACRARNRRFRLDSLREPLPDLPHARYWMRGLDSNQRALGYGPNLLLGCSIPQKRKSPARWRGFHHSIRSLCRLRAERNTTNLASVFGRLIRGNSGIETFSLVAVCFFFRFRRSHNLIPLVLDKYCNRFALGIFSAGERSMRPASVCLQVLRRQTLLHPVAT